MNVMNFNDYNNKLTAMTDINTKALELYEVLVILFAEKPLPEKGIKGSIESFINHILSELGGDNRIARKVLLEFLGDGGGVSPELKEYVLKHGTKAMHEYRAMGVSEIQTMLDAALKNGKQYMHKWEDSLDKIKELEAENQQLKEALKDVVYYNDRRNEDAIWNDVIRNAKNAI